MPSDYARRGRPRGSGLDDRVQLRRIVDLLEADPTLRPTTAIKAIGVNDPSTIRRLRDKLKSDTPGSPSPSSPSRAEVRGSVAGSQALRSPELLEAAPKPIPNSSSRDVARDGQRFSAGYLATADLVAAADRAVMPEPQASWLAAWCAFGLHAFSATVEAQMAVMEDLFQMPQVASALRQQLLFNDVAKAFCPKSPDIRATLH